MAQRRGGSWLVGLGLAGILAGAAAVRAWRLNRLELQHWDEGAYALGAQWVVTRGSAGEPMHPFYAPPVFPVLVAGSFRLFGVSAPAAIGVSVVTGTATIAALFLLVRSVWGSAAGLMAAVFLAACEFHILYSRMALTDATFAFLVVVGLGAFSRALGTGRWRDYAAAGAVAGTLQNTKYHGVLLLALVGTYVGVPWAWTLVGRRGDRRPHHRCLLGVLLAIGVAAVLYAPWVVLVQRTIGYGALLRHTRGYAHWLPAEFGFWCACATRYAPAGVWLLAGVGCATAAFARRRGRLAVLALAGFSVAPLFYQTYPRLILPAVVLACGVAGAGLAWLLGFLRTGGDGAGRWMQVLAGALLTGAVAFRSLWSALPLLAQAPSGYPQAAAFINALPSEARVFTDAKHCVWFYLTHPAQKLVSRRDLVRAPGPRLTWRRAGQEPPPPPVGVRAFMKAHDFERYLVVDLHVIRHRVDTPEFPAYLDALDQAGHRVTGFDNPLNDETLLNTFGFADLDRLRAGAVPRLAGRALRISIYRIPAGWAPP